MEPGLKAFCDKRKPQMIHYLRQTYLCPIFGDDYKRLPEDDTFVASRDDNYLKEQGNYSSGDFSRNKEVTSIDWKHGATGVIAVSLKKSMSLAERFEEQRNVEKAVSIVWDFKEQMNPQFVLESPAEVLSIKYCPTRPNIIIGACINGQVVIWNTDNVSKEAQGKKRGHGAKLHARRDAGPTDDAEIPPMVERVKGHTLVKSGDHMVSRLAPVYSSKVQGQGGGHRRAVHDIQWLPANLECTLTGRLEDRPGQDLQNQFATISEDGAMCIWDIREDVFTANPKAQKLKSTNIGDDKLFIPVFRVPLTRPESAGGDVALGLRFCMEGKPNPYLMCCTTIEGEFCQCYWAPKDERAALQQFGDHGHKEDKMIRQVTAAHAGPGWVVQRHPTFPEYYLTVGDWGFKIWRLGLSSPILASPHNSDPVLCGRWSPTRPAVLFTATKTGSIHVWDLLDRSHEKLFYMDVTADAITTLEFKPRSERKHREPTKQTLVAGTDKGSFLLFEVPEQLVKAHSNEEHNARKFFEREARRVDYFQWRWEEREAEMNLKLQQDRGADGAKGALRDGDDAGDEDLEYMGTAEDDAAFMSLVEELAKDEETEVAE